MGADSIPDRLRQIRQEADRRDEEIRRRADWLDRHRHPAEGRQGPAGQPAGVPDPGAPAGDA